MEKKTEQELCDTISRKLHRAEAELAAVIHDLVPELIKLAPDCSKGSWACANRQMYKGLGHIMIAHSDMGDCRDVDFPDVTTQSGGT